MRNWPKEQVQPENHVDTTETNRQPTHISLCSGYGGIDLGLKRVLPDLRTVAYAEIEAFACELLLARMEAGQLDAAPIWSNLKSFPWGAFSDRVDILSGGYPCQPFSAAGRRLGTEDERHLWPYIADGIRILRPRICLFENVEGHITLGLSTVISDLEELGYTVSWGIFSAAEVGAPHQRKRVFILANRADNGFPRSLFDREAFESPQRDSTSGEGSDVAYRNNEGLQGHWRYVAEHDAQRRQEQAGHAWPSRPGELQFGWEPPRVVADARRNAGERRCSVGEVPCGDDGASGAGEAGGEGGQDVAGEWSLTESGGIGAEPAMGNAEVLDGSGQTGRQRETPSWRTGTARNHGQTESEVGGDVDGPSGGMDYGLLCCSSDNRTDELRLLGNGVVPATAAKAFVTLMEELL